MKNLERLIAEFPTIVKLMAEELKTVYLVSLGKQFRDQDDKFYNNTTQLRRSRGSKSLVADISKKSKLKIEGGKVVLDIETDKPYAGIQNRGGFINATPIQRTLKSGKTIKTYKMAQYFWAKYFEASVGTRKNIYKRMALSVEKKGGVKIKGKHYIENSLKDFEETGLERVLQGFLLQVSRIWNAS